MTVLNFPASPTVNDTYTANNVTYMWNGNYWDANNTGSLDDIYVEVSGDVMTGNLQLPGGGGNTAALQKQEIDALIVAGDIAGDHWDRAAGALSPKVLTDNVEIGDGKITLNADGSIDATSTVTLSNSISSRQVNLVYNPLNTALDEEDRYSLFIENTQETQDTALLFRSTTGGEIVDTKLTRAGVLTIRDKITLDGLDGHINAAGGKFLVTANATKIGDNTGSSSQDLSSVVNKSEGTVSIFHESGSTKKFLQCLENGVSTRAQIFSNGSSEFAGDMAIGTTGSFTFSTPAISLNASGSGDFAGNVLSGSEPGNGANAGAKFGKTGFITVTRDGPNQPVFSAYQLGITDKSIEFLADGSAKFADGNLLIGNDGKLTSLWAGNQVNLNYYSSAEGSYLIRAGEPTDRKFSVSTTGSVVAAGNVAIGITGSFTPSTPAISLNASGSAVFAGTVNGLSAGTCFNAKVETDNTQSTFKGNDSANTVTFSVRGSGTAYFKGNVTAANVTFNLEADDDTKYTSTTNEEGEQTLVYNGAVLDVKELLLSLQTAAARIEALEARLDAAGV